MKEVVIKGTGQYTPTNIVTNDDLSCIVDTNDEWVYSRTGIKSRKISKTEKTTELGVKAGIKALSDANIEPVDIDLIIVATMTPDQFLPNTACEIQREIGADNAVCMDLNAACSGFVYALNTAIQFIKTGTYGNALVIGTETVSKLIDWTDRATCVLFGDGAGAVVIESSDDVGFINMSMGSNGKLSEALTCRVRRLENLLTDKKPIDLDYMKMQGQEIFKFVCSTIPNSIKKTLEGTEYDLEDVNIFIMHQANQRIINSVAKRLDINREKFYTNVEKYGNTSAASIPIALDEAIKEGKAKKGDICILSGFGGGLTWGTTLIKL